jgi:hypothetical protein
MVLGESLRGEDDGDAIAAGESELVNFPSPSQLPSCILGSVLPFMHHAGFPAPG